MNETSEAKDGDTRKRRHRSGLPKDDARRRYLQMGSLAALEQIHRDAEELERDAMAIGPFARLDAGAVAASDGKTRGAITNLFGSQATYQVRTMGMVLDAAEISELSDWPAPDTFTEPETWVAAFFASQSARGPSHGSEPVMSYSSLWALWLGVVPYGIRSERIAAPSMDEHVRRVAQIEAVFAKALEHFGLTLCGGATLADLACGAASLIEGVWLNQCLTGTHPRDPDLPISEVLVRAGLMLWRGAVQ
jgi:hypothetical protein